MGKKLYIELGKCMRDARISKDFTQQEVADRLGVSRQTITHWESGRRCVYIDDLFKYCDILGVDVNDVIAPVRKFTYKK